MEDNSKLTRRKVLAGLGTIGAAGALGGAGTVAFFSDTETFEGNQLVAGALDLKVDWQQTYNGEAVNAYPDDDGDGLQSLNGVQYGGPGAESDASQIPGVCCTCADDEYVVTFGGDQYCIEPIEGEESVQEFYGFGNVSSFESDIDFAESNTSLLFLYRDGDDNLSLVIHHDDGEDSSGGAATFQFSGTSGTSWQVRDDAPGNDSYGFTSGNISSADWQWSGGKTDGGAIGFLDDFVIEITPEFESGLNTWKLLDGDASNQHVLAAGLEEDGEPGPLTIASECQDLASGDELPVPDVYQSPNNPEQEHLVEITDVKPGDEGEITFSLHLCDNPGYLWLTADNFTESENGMTEPERKDPDESGELEDGTNPGELAENVLVSIWYDEDCDNELDEDEQLVFGPGIGGYTDMEGDNPATLAAAMDVIQRNGGRIPLDGEAPFMGYDEGATSEERDCLPGNTTLCVGVKWEVPPDHANEIQTDGVTFDLGFYTEQCRHNDGSGLRQRVATSTGTGFVAASQQTNQGGGYGDDGENFNGDESISGGVRARYGDRDGNQTWELAVGDEPGSPGDFNEAQYDWTIGDTVDWSVSYDEAADELTFTFDGVTFTSGLTDQPDGRIGVQGKADEATVEVENVSLEVGGEPVALDGPSGVTASNDSTGRDIRYLVVDAGLDGDTSFTLTGTVTTDTNQGFQGGEEDIAFDVVLE